MANQQKGVQQDTAYMAVTICIPVPAYIIFSCFYNPFWVKNDVGTEIHTIIHEMIFILVPLIFLR